MTCVSRPWEESGGLHFSYTNRDTEFTKKLFVRVEVTEKFLFLSRNCRLFMIVNLKMIRRIEMNMPRFVADASLYRTNRYYQLRAAVTTDIGGQVVPAQKGTSPVCKEDPTCPSGGRIFNCRNDNPDICFRTEKCCTPPPPPTVCGPCQLNPATLQFTQNCTSGTNQFSIPCSSCTPEAKIDLPFPISDRCVKVCCRSADLSTCSITVREC